MIIGILWKDKLAVKMFVDHYRRFYTNRGKPLTVAPSYYHSADITEALVKSSIASDKAVSEGLFILMEVPSVFDTSMTPKVLLEACDMIVGISRDLVPDPIKVVSQEHMAILDRWCKNNGLANLFP